jgi:ABC-2 type transport system ATP-binding protein
VILDEPFAGLDPVASEELAAILRERVARGCTVVLSSHQLDLVQDLCSQIVMIDRGRAVLAGEVASLRAASGGRQLRLGFAGPHRRDWLAGYPQVAVVSDDADALRLSLPAGTDPLELLDAARACGVVSDFGLDTPTLSQLFMMHVEPGAGSEEQR